MAGSPSVLRFVERCLIPYLYGYSHFSATGVMPFDELYHGELGSLQDLTGLLGTKMDDALPFCFLASMLRRRANKRPCPCGSGWRLGRCHNRRVNALRESGQPHGKLAAHGERPRRKSWCLDHVP